METSHYVLLVVFVVPCLCYDVYIYRDEKDTTYGMSECMEFTRTTHSFTNPWFWETCTCKTEYTTMMSKENEVYNCFTPAEVGCDYSLTVSKQAYLVTTRNISKGILPKINGRNSSIHRVLVWNLYPAAVENGNWEDITAQTSANFSLKVQSGHTFLSISNLSAVIWKGLLIKVELEMKGSPKSCIILKVKGNATYPIDVHRRLGVIPPTRPPTTTARTKNITTTFHSKTTGRSASTTARGVTSDIYRYVKDTTYGFACIGFERTTGSWGVCTCKADYTTMMSKDMETYNCRTPAEVGCQYTLAGSKQAFLITKGEVNERLTHNVNERCNKIHRILIWNFHPEIYERGKWVDITNKTAAKFTLNFQSYHKYYFLSISNLNMDAWIGLTVKIELRGNDSCQGCTIVKVQGRIAYPIDINKLLRKLTIPPPPTTTTTLSPRSYRSGDNDSRDTTVGKIAGTILAVVAAVIIACIIYYRRRAGKNIKLNTNDMRVESHDGSAVTNAGYEMEQCDKRNYFDPNRQNSTVELVSAYDTYVVLERNAAIAEADEGEEGEAKEEEKEEEEVKGEAVTNDITDDPIAEADGGEEEGEVQVKEKEEEEEKGEEECKGAVSVII